MTEKYRVTPIRPGYKYPPMYVRGADAIEGAIERIGVKWGDRPHMRPTHVEIARGREWFSNGSWKTGYAQVEIREYVEPQEAT